jgi:hypothetical protein
LSPFAYLAWIAVTILHSSSYLRLSYAFSIQQGENIDMPDDLRTWKSTGTSCEIEIHFSVQTIKFLMKYKFFSRFRGKLKIVSFCFQAENREMVCCACADRLEDLLSSEGECVAA